MSVVVSTPVRREWRRFLAAVQYFTRVPVPRWVGHDAELLNGATRYFPLVGLIIGAIAADCFWFASYVFPPLVVAVLSTMLTIALTGAFHEDGLADTYDGLGGSSERERALEIMKDSRIGTFGAAALVLALLLKTTALAAFTPGQAVVALLTAHALSRACAVFIIAWLPYVSHSDSSRAKPVVERIERRDVIIASAFGLAPLALCGWQAGLVLIAVLGVTAYLCYWYQRRIGGYTGDLLGAAQQLTELACYLALLAKW
jgi:adenosylcobinamide-GDP ribazoletransferase